MAKFRKKPVVIEATQWFKNGDHPEDYAKDRVVPEENGCLLVKIEGVEMRVTRYSGEYRRQRNWEGDVVRYFRHPDVPGDRECLYCGKSMHEHGWVDPCKNRVIDPIEGGHIVCPGDWIITGSQGEYWPCKPDIFEATYEPSDDTASVRRVKYPRRGPLDREKE